MVPCVLAELPEGQMTAFTHVSADGRRLCVPTTDARALDGDALLEGKPGMISMRERAGKISRLPRVFCTETGRELLCEEVRQGVDHSRPIFSAERRLDSLQSRMGLRARRCAACGFGMAISIGR